MAAILIVEDDGLVARHMAQALRQSGHTPIVAHDARSALREAIDSPDIILLDLGLPDLPGEELLQSLSSLPETVQIPVLVVTGRRDAAARLGEQEKTGVRDILLKPVSAAQLCRAVNVALGGQGELDARALRLAQEQQRDLIQRILIDGSDPLAFHICRRMSLDRIESRGSISGEVLTWGQIAQWARREGLVDSEQARLIRGIPVTRPQKLRGASA